MGTHIPTAEKIDLESFDFSQPELFESDRWRPFFERLRREDPVHFTPSSPFGPYWSITRFADIVDIDTNHHDFSSEGNILIGDLGDDLPGESFIQMDPPKHDVQRKAVQPVVAPKNLQELEPIIRHRVKEILDNLPVNEPFDWVENVSINLTTQMLATLLGFPAEDRGKLTYWSDLVAGTPELAGGDADPAERLEGLLDCLKRFTEIWHAKRSENKPGFDLISLLQHGQGTHDMVDRPMEFLGTLALLIVGGNDTTRNSISGSVLALNQHPAELDKLRASPELIQSFVPEVIRWQTPLMHMRRTASRDVEFRGKHIKKGDKVVMWYISGNRDNEVIPDADRFIIDRMNPRHH
ncbi:MAG: cytochrome P450, partial [Alcanivoracaceae bacterium]|nr:cytochrome P450 [Alcanivoracaceae bacterium]